MILQPLPIALNHFLPTYLGVLEGEASDPGKSWRAVTTHGGAGREPLELPGGKSVAQCYLYPVDQGHRV